MDEAEWIEAFTRTATALYPDDPETASFAVTMERARLAGFIDEPEMFPYPRIRNAWRSTFDAMAGQISPKSDLQPGWQRLLEIGDFAVPGSAAVTASAVDLEKMIHNERVKLNATFFNTLAVWFAGAGAAGALFNTLMASGIRNYSGAEEIGAASS